jgi:hypothetical protein
LPDKQLRIRALAVEICKAIN